MPDAQRQPPPQPEQPPRGTADPTRREVLAGMAGAAALILAPGAAAAASGGQSALLRASARLTGIALDASYLDLARSVWAALAPTYGVPALERLVQVVNAAPEKAPLKDLLLAQGLLPVAQAVTGTWYTGASAADGGQTVLFYNDALMWRSCDFTKPPATCGGPFGYWEQAYTPAATDKA